MVRDIDRFEVSGVAGIVKISRRRRARVVLPELDGPERPMSRLLCDLSDWAIILQRSTSGREG